jgi:hypothetical protein
VLWSRGTLAARLGGNGPGRAASKPLGSGPGLALQNRRDVGFPTFGAFDSANLNILPRRSGFRQQAFVRCFAAHSRVLIASTSSFYGCLFELLFPSQLCRSNCCRMCSAAIFRFSLRDIKLSVQHSQTAVTG